MLGMLSASVWGGPFKRMELPEMRLESGGGLHDPGELGERRSFGPQRGRTVGGRAVLRAELLAQTPAAYLGRRPMRVSARPVGLRRHESGWQGRVGRLTVYLSEAARWQLEGHAGRGQAVFRGEVRRDASGRAALYLEPVEGGVR